MSSRWERFSMALHFGVGGVAVGLLTLHLTGRVPLRELEAFYPFILCVCLINMSVLVYNIGRDLKKW
jgi:hypothetical protein